MAVYSDLPIVGQVPEVAMARFMRQERAARVAFWQQFGDIRTAFGIPIPFGSRVLIDYEPPHLHSSETKNLVRYKGANLFID